MKLYDELLWRGLIENITDEDLIEKINNGGLTFYIGTDPTGDSLHIGHYSTFSMATRLKQGGTSKEMWLEALCLQKPGGFKESGFFRVYFLPES